MTATDLPELTEAEWLHDLRTTDAKQGMNVLRDHNDLFCCLGRGCQIDRRVHGVPPLPDNRYPYVYKIGDLYLNNDFPSPTTGFSLWSETIWSWMTNAQAQLCVRANDNVGMSFPEIADWWEAGQPVDSEGLPVRVDAQ